MSSPLGSTATRGRNAGIVLAGRFFMPAMLAIPIVAALDDGRYHWFHVPWWGCVLGYALLITGMVGLTWAESVNKFFEPTVRIQTDRGHKVIDTGPYAIVRHPGYVSGFLLFLGMPLCLGSLWALIPAILLCLLLVVRTIWEDQTLREELAGYEEYAQRVRYQVDSWGVVNSSAWTRVRSGSRPGLQSGGRVQLSPKPRVGIDPLTALVTYRAVSETFPPHRRDRHRCRGAA